MFLIISVRLRLAEITDIDYSDCEGNTEWGADSDTVDSD